MAFEVEDGIDGGQEHSRGVTFVGVPAVVESSDALLSTAQQLIDNETAALEADPNVTVSCRPNCNACCEHAVVVTAAEHRAIATVVAELPAQTRQLIASRARQLVELVASALSIDPMQATSFDQEFLQGYYALREPCPLLVDGACIVRSERPLVCREYLMSSAPEHCGDRTLERAVKIRRRRHVSAGFQHVSSGFGDSNPQLLSVALLQAPDPIGSRPMSGPKLARQLTSHR